MQIKVQTERSSKGKGSARRRRRTRKESISGWVYEIGNREQALRKIELPSEELAEELQKHLQDGRFAGATYDKGEKTIQFPDNMNPSQWSGLKGTVEKWAKGKRLEVVESLKL